MHRDTLDRSLDMDNSQGRATHLGNNLRVVFRRMSLVSEHIIDDAWYMTTRDILRFYVLHYYYILLIVIPLCSSHCTHTDNKIMKYLHFDEYTLQKSARLRA